MNTLLSLGKFKFTVSKNTWDTMKFKASYRWATFQNIGSQDVLQFDGINAPTISIDCTLYTRLAGPVESIFYELKETAAKGEPLFLIDKNGINYGRWVITSITSNNSKYNEDGVAQKSKLTLEIKGFDLC